MHFDILVHQYGTKGDGTQARASDLVIFESSRANQRASAKYISSNITLLFPSSRLYFGREQHREATLKKWTKSKWQG